LRELTVFTQKGGDMLRNVERVFKVPTHSKFEAAKTDTPLYNAVR
jgi:hypothetical protein